MKLFLTFQTAVLVLVAAGGFPGRLAAQSPWVADAFHDHWRKACRGVLQVDSAGISYREDSSGRRNAKDIHSWTWADEDIRELRIEPGQVTVISYIDGSRWRLGADRGYHFRIPQGRVQDLSGLLRGRLGTRMVVAFAEPGVLPLWELPVKRLGAVKGSHGKLIIGENQIVFEAAENGNSRTWGLDDIENVSSAGPFQLTITTFEQDKLQYGSVKAFVFQLKQPLVERRYDDLWLAVNLRKGLRTLQDRPIR